MKLALAKLSVWYGAAQVVFDLDLQIEAGETVALVGRNGAGKTTVLQSVLGIGGMRRGGSVQIDGVETIGMETHEVARLGVGLVPEGRRVFSGLSVKENLQVAASSAARARGGEAERWPLERVWDVFPVLERAQGSKGKVLSGGEQQILAIARALVGDPDVLLLDEPSEGLAPKVVETLIEQLLIVKRAGLTILLAEQHRGMVETLASRACQLERGTIVWSGEPAELFECRAARLEQE